MSQDMSSIVEATSPPFSLMSLWGPLDNATLDCWQKKVTLGACSLSSRIDDSLTRASIQQCYYLDHLAEISKHAFYEPRMLPMINATSCPLLQFNLASPEINGWHCASISCRSPSIATIEDVLVDLWDPVDSAWQNTWPERVDLASRDYSPWAQISHIPLALEQRHRAKVSINSPTVQSLLPDLWDQDDNSPHDPWPNRSISLLPANRALPQPIARPWQPLVVDDDTSDSDEESDLGIYSWSDASSISESSILSSSGSQLDEWE